MNSTLTTLLFPSSPPSTLTANNHFAAGIIALGATIELFGSPVTGQCGRCLRGHLEPRG